MRITAILTCHNRRERTLACVRSYFSQSIPPNVTLSATIVDDGCTDGTAAAVRALGVEAEVVTASGNLFWAAGMALAEEHAMRSAPDFLLWLNDDVVLDEGAVTLLLEVAGRAPGPDRIVVGATSDATGSRITYAGVARSSRLHPMKFTLVSAQEIPALAETFHGNVVLVPRSVYRTVGGIDRGFVHAAADFDYGLRATALGFVVLVAPGKVGVCEREVGPRPWLEGDLRLADRLRVAFSAKGLPQGSRARYLRRHGGTFWLLFFLAPYCRLPGDLLAASVRNGPLRRRLLRRTAR